MYRYVYKSLVDGAETGCVRLHVPGAIQWEVGHGVGAAANHLKDDLGWRHVMDDARRNCSMCLSKTI